MPVKKCQSCGYVSDYAVNSQCLRCGAVIDISSKFNKATKTIRTVIVVFSLLFIIGGIGYGTTVFITNWKENVRIEAEKKELESFDYTTFNSDADSVSKALEALPRQFSLAQPPSLELVKQTVGEFISKKVKKAEYTQQSLSDKFRSVQNHHFEAVEETTVYSLKDIQTIQYDYVKGAGDKLFCFVSYRAVITTVNRDDYINYASNETHGQVVKEKTKKPRDTELGDTIVFETARYAFENGNWTFREAGFSELNRKLEIDKIRIEAQKSKQY